MPNDINKKLVKDLREKISKAKSITFTDYLGLSVNNINDLRRKLNESEAELVVAKNTLIRTALNEEKVKEAEKANKDLEGPTAAIFAYKDGVSPLKVIFEFIKNIELPKIKAGFFEGTYVTAGQVEEISKLPSKEQLIARFIGSLKSPLYGTVNVFSGVQKKFVYAIKAIADKKVN